MRQAGMNDLAVLLEAGLLGDALGGGIGREDEGDHLLEVQLAGPVDGSDSRLGGEAVAVEVGFDAPGELYCGGAFHRGPGEAAAAGEGAALLLDQDPGAEAVVLPVDAVAFDQFVEHLGVEGGQGGGTEPGLHHRLGEMGVVEGAVVGSRLAGEEPLGLPLPRHHAQGRSVRGS